MSRSQRLDQLGVVASSLCAVHCFLGAVLVGATGLMSSLRDERTEWLLLAVSIAVAGASLGLSYLKAHRNCRPLVLLGLALLPLAMAHLVSWQAGAIETMLSICGALVLVIAHVWNVRLLRAHPGSACCADGDCRSGRR